MLTFAKLYVFSVTALLSSIPLQINAETCRVAEFVVEGASMSPRIAPHQTIQVTMGDATCWGSLRHNDVVIFHSDNSRIPLVKAIRGLPDDTLSVSDGHIVINGKSTTNSSGQLYQLPAPRAAMIGLYAHDYVGVIPRNMFLVMGENIHGSTDSSRFGFVGSDQIIGKVVE